MRVLVTGGAGFIGSSLARACLEAGDDVRVLDDLSAGRLENLEDVQGELELVRGCVTDPEALRMAVRGREVVYHQAALVSVPLSIEAPLRSHAVNATGTLHVLEAARRADVRRVVFASSSAVYGDCAPLPCAETLAPDPSSPYALQKLVGERYCALFASLHGLETLALRFFNVFGPRQDPCSPYAAVIPMLVDALVSGRAPVIHGDGQQTRDFVYVGDVVDALRAAAVASGCSGRAVNVARGTRVSVLDLYDEVARLLGCEGLRPEFVGPRQGDVRHSQADVSLAAELLGFRARCDFAAGLAETVEYFVRDDSGRKRA